MLYTYMIKRGIGVWISRSDVKNLNQLIILFFGEDHSKTKCRRYNFMFLTPSKFQGFLDFTVNEPRYHSVFWVLFVKDSCYNEPYVCMGFIGELRVFIAECSRESRVFLYQFEQINKSICLIIALWNKIYSENNHKTFYPQMHYKVGVC